MIMIIIITSTPIITLYIPDKFTSIPSTNAARNPIPSTDPPMMFNERFNEPFRIRERTANIIKSIDTVAISWLETNEILER